jgi:hypothetical protein
MSDAAIVTTTINYPKKTFNELARAGQLIVAGDLRTPPETAELVRSLDGIYLTPAMQSGYLCSSFIGWNSIQRRNIAFLEAARLGMTHVVTVDDDNCPKDAVQWMSEHINGINDIPTTVRATASQWFNPGSMLRPPVVARGMPYYDAMSVRQSAIPHSIEVSSTCKVGVNAGLCLGDPDVDAMQRITTRPFVTDIAVSMNIAIAPDTFAPINSQNTMWRRELLPLAVVLPHVGRWDDIYGGYLAQWSFWRANFVTSYGGPLVTQERNDHDLFTDLEKEIDGYRDTPAWVKLLQSIDASGNPLKDLALLASILRIKRDYNPWPRVARFLDAWIQDWENTAS